MFMYDQNITKVLQLNLFYNIYIFPSIDIYPKSFFLINNSSWVLVQFKLEQSCNNVITRFSD